LTFKNDVLEGFRSLDSVFVNNSNGWRI